ncbi:MAG: ThuA domain-containing protein [Balneolaceae bacterium]|nr:ThuA domain-containing protein [Balneolaceae bacterium]
MQRISLAILVLFAFHANTCTAQPVDQEQTRLLVFTKTDGFRHSSIPDGVQALREIGGENDFSIDHTEDAALFSAENLQQYDAVVFLNTTEDVLNDEQQDAFKQYINGGGGFVGIHAASDTEYGWPWYGRLVGAYFVSHPSIQEATIRVLNRNHPSTSHLPAEWVRTDEWYNFKEIQPHINVLANLDESTYRGGENGENHPIAWYHEFEGGRVFYTAGGHTSESYSEPLFRQHLLGGIRYVLGKN